MTVTLTLPPDVEQAFLAEASASGLSIDVFLARVLVSRITAPISAPSSFSDQQEIANSGTQLFPLQREDGIPVLRTGQPLAPSIVDDTLHMIRREREVSAIGNM